MEGGSFPHLGIEGQGPAVLLDDDGSRDREPLARAAPHLFVGEEGIEDESVNGFGNPATGVADVDIGEVAFRPGPHLDETFTIGATDDFVDGVRGVDDDVQNGLTHVAGKQTTRGNSPRSVSTSAMCLYSLLAMVSVAMGRRRPLEILLRAALGVG